MSKVNDFDPRGIIPEQVDFNDDVRSILNFGKYQAQVVTSAPTWIGRLGEFVFHLSGGKFNLMISATDSTTTWASVSNSVQVVNTQTGAMATGTTVIPLDDSIPQNNEGDEYMTLAITPTNTSNVLKITVVWNGAQSSTDRIVAALFQDSTANALACASTYEGNTSTIKNITFVHYMTAGTISATTFKVRAGGTGAGTITFNGEVGARLFGGTIASSITIEELR